MRLSSILICAGAALTFTAANAASTYDGNGQVPQQFVLSGKAADRLHDHMSINADTAEKLSKACEAIAKRNNSQVVVIVLDPQGLVVHEHRMDGEGWIQVKATEQKALTALRTRAPSHALANRNVQDPFTKSKHVRLRIDDTGRWLAHHQQRPVDRRHWRWRHPAGRAQRDLRRRDVRARCAGAGDRSSTTTTSGFDCATCSGRGRRTGRPRRAKPVTAKGAGSDAGPRTLGLPKG